VRFVTQREGDGEAVKIQRVFLEPSRWAQDSAGRFGRQPEPCRWRSLAVKTRTERRGPRGV